jgi:hypothetical protein
MARSRVLRHALFAAFVIAAAFVAVSGSTAAQERVSLRAPARVFQGQRVDFSASVNPAGKVCQLSIAYHGGRVQRLQIQQSGGGRVLWTLRIPNVPEGRAAVRLRCDGAGSASVSMLVERALQAPKITIEDSGFTQRPRRYSPGSDVSYGLVIKNARPQADAENVTLLVNFVDATNRILGSAHDRISRLPANTTITYGGQQGIPTQDQVTRLEVIVGATPDRRELAVPPLISDIIIAPRSFEPYVESVRGQLLNTRDRPMRTGTVGVVILNAEGGIIGGGAGYASGPLAYGAREAFSVSGSFSAIPFKDAAAALVSVVPRYDD